MLNRNELTNLQKTRESQNSNEHTATFFTLANR